MSDLKIIHTKPCPECPWRKIAPPGWLGGHDVEVYSQPVKYGVLVPCHMNGHRAYCAGAAITMQNSCTSPRDPRMAAEVDKVKRSDEVFRFATDFEKHHRDGLFKSKRKR